MRTGLADTSAVRRSGGIARRDTARNAGHHGFRRENNPGSNLLYATIPWRCVLGLRRGQHHAGIAASGSGWAVRPAPRPKPMRFLLVFPAIATAGAADRPVGVSNANYAR